MDWEVRGPEAARLRFSATWRPALSLRGMQSIGRMFYEFSFHTAKGTSYKAVLGSTLFSARIFCHNTALGSGIAITCMHRSRRPGRV